jgi:predicted RNase H-like nuclease
MLFERLGWDLQALKGEGRKRYEDTLDALFRAYLARHCWRCWQEKNLMFGAMEDGYIVVGKG